MKQKSSGRNDHLKLKMKVTKLGTFSTSEIKWTNCPLDTKEQPQVPKLGTCGKKKIKLPTWELEPINKERNFCLW